MTTEVKASFQYRTNDPKKDVHLMGWAKSRRTQLPMIH